VEVDDDSPIPGVRPPSDDLLAKFAAIGEVMQQHTPTDEHWYLNVLATHPDWQRHGLGASIIAPVAEICRRDGLPLYLETESTANVAYYSHLGFRVRSEWDVPLDGPHMWGMIRQPRA
jgi:GNAT superfamily N-acetyltransferase